MVVDLSGLDAPSRKFGRDLQTSQLLAGETLQAAFAKLKSGRGDAHPFVVATWMIEEGHISRWQAEQLLGGRTTFTLGKYRLLEKIGSGGMGAVYKAEQIGMGRIVAIKLMEQELLKKPGAIDRFLREIQTVAKLHHPNIVAAYDADQVAGRYFLVLEYAEGQDLELILYQTAKLPPAAACEVIIQAANGLQHAFECGVVHRDIKPGNLLVTKGADGQMIVKILDMGLARFVLAAETENASLTKTGQIMGTPDYMAPEQVEDTRHVDIRGDIYALGACLFEMLIGQVPFPEGPSTKRMMERITTDAPGIRTLDPSLPEALESVVAKLLARNPDDRFATPKEAAAALAQFAHDGGKAMDEHAANSPRADASSFAHLSSQSLASLASTRDDTGSGVALQAAVDRSLDEFGYLVQNIDASAKEANRGAQLAQLQAAADRGGRWKFIAAALCVLAAAGGYAWYELGAAQLTIEWPRDENAGSLEVDGKWMAAPTSGKVSLDGRSGERKLRLTRPGYEPVETTITLDRGERRLYQPDWTPLPQTARDLAWKTLEKEAADYRSLNAFNPRLNQFVHRVLKEQASQSGVGDVISGTRILATLPNPMDSFDPSKIESRQLRPRVERNVPLMAVLGVTDAGCRFWRPISHVSYSADGRFLAASTMGVLQIFDTKIKKVSLYLSHAALGNCFTQNGKTLVSSGINELFMFETETSERIRRLTFTGYLTSTQVAPNGLSYLVSGYQSQLNKSGLLEIWDWKAKTGDAPLVKFPNPATTVVASLFTPGGNFVLAACEDDPIVRLWDVKSATVVREIEGQKTEVRRLAVHAPSEQWAASGDDKTVRIFSLANHQLVRVLSGADHSVQSIAFAPDGRHVLGGSTSGQLCLWKADDGTLLHRQTAHYGRITSIAFAPDGASFVSGGDDCCLRHWRFENDTITEVDTGCSPWIESAAVRDDSRMIAGGSLSGDIHVWDVPSNQPRSWKAHSSRVNAIQFAPASNVLASGGNEGKVMLWNSDDGSLLRKLEKHTDSVRVLAFSPNGKLLASGGDDDAIRIWDVATGEVVQELFCDNYSFKAMAWHPDNKRLVVSNSQYQVVLWDAEKGSMLLSRDYVTSGMHVNSFSFAQDGSKLAFGQFNYLRCWDLVNSRDEALATAPYEVVAACFDPFGQRIIYGANDGFLKLSDMRTAVSGIEWQIASTYSNAAQILSTRDGRFLVTRNRNGSLYVLRAPAR